MKFAISRENICVFLFIASMLCFRLLVVVAIDRGLFWLTMVSNWRSAIAVSVLTVIVLLVLKILALLVLQPSMNCFKFQTPTQLAIVESALATKIATVTVLTLKPFKPICQRVHKISQVPYLWFNVMPNSLW